MSITYTSGVWKLDGSQWKVDEINPKLVEGSMGMYCWEIQCLDMINTDTTKIEGQTTANQPDVSITCTSGVWKLDGSQLKVDEINPKLVEGSMGVYCWEI